MFSFLLVMTSGQETPEHTRGTQST